MIESIDLKNFKSFHQLHNLQLKPITVLCGTNSSGKSTILQSILLAKQTIESKQPSQTLLFNGRLVRLGTFENIVFEKKPDNKVLIEFSFHVNKDTFPKESENILPFKDILAQLGFKKGLRITETEYIINYKVILAVGKRRNPKTHLKSIIVENLSMSLKVIDQGNQEIDKLTLDIQLKNNNNYKIRWENSQLQESKPISAKGKVRFTNLFPVSINIEDKNPGRKRLKGSQLFEVELWLEQVVRSALSTYAYIGPLREEPSRRYIYEDEVTEIGVKGENAAYISLAQQDKSIKDCYFYDSQKDSFYPQNGSIQLLEALRTWLSLMGIEDFKPHSTKEVINLNVQANTSKKTNVNIADVGFGVSQILPIVLEGLRMPKGNTLLLEQPEIHLHPNLQMQMADYFIALALSNKQVIVETHSDHIVNRLVRRIVEDTDYDLEKLIGIYFITAGPKGSKCTEVKIDPERGVVNWPADFFDQTASELERTIQAGLKKRKREK